MPVYSHLTGEETEAWGDDSPSGTESGGGGIRTQICYSTVFWSVKLWEVPPALPVPCQAQLSVVSLEWLGDCEK